MVDRDTRFDELLESMYRKGLEQREMTAKEIFDITGGEKFSSPNEISTVIGRNLEDTRIEKINRYPNKYKIQKSGAY